MNDDLDDLDDNGICICHDCQIYNNEFRKDPIIKITDVELTNVNNTLATNNSMNKYHKQYCTNDSHKNLIICSYEYAGYFEGKNSSSFDILVCYKYEGCGLKYEMFIDIVSFEIIGLHAWGKCE